MFNHQSLTDNKIAKQISDIIKADNNRGVEFIRVRSKNWRGFILGKGSIEVWTYSEDSMATIGDKRFLMTSQSISNSSTSEISRALSNILDYVKKDALSHKFPMTNEDSYTVEWMKKGEHNENESNIITSYFSAKNPKHLLEKFYAGKDERDYIIFLIKLNPLS